jgi:hypothetical protein
MAGKLLEKNTSNRRYKPGKVAGYAKEMREGRWKLNGESIILSKDGRLLNGQHRLRACILAGVGFDCLVVTGVEDDAFDTMDIGATRTGGDVLQIVGEKNAKELAATLNLLYVFDSGSENFDKGNLPRSMLRDVLAEHPTVREHVVWGSSHYHPGSFLTKPVLAFTRYAFTRIDPVAADDFCERLVTGVNLHQDDPILVLRNRLQRAATSKERLNRRDVLAYIIKAWNSYRLGIEVRGIKFSKGEPFPLVHGWSRQRAA